MLLFDISFAPMHEYNTFTSCKRIIFLVYEIPYFITFLRKERYFNGFMVFLVKWLLHFCIRSKFN